MIGEAGKEIEEDKEGLDTAAGGAQAMDGFGLWVGEGEGDGGFEVGDVLAKGGDWVGEIFCGGHNGQMRFRHGIRRRMPGRVGMRGLPGRSRRPRPSLSRPFREGGLLSR